MIHLHDLRLPENDQRVVEWLAHLSDNLRQSDLDEVAAMSGLDPLTALATSLALSTHAWVVTRPDGVPAAIYGAAPGPLEGVGIVWMLGTEDIRRYGISIAKKTRPVTDELNAAYPILWNYIDARNELSQRWLRWAGYETIGHIPEFGPERRPFHIFARTRYV